MPALLSVQPPKLQVEVDEAVEGFSVVMADPPWRFKSNSVAKPGRNSLRHYKCPTLEQLCTLPLKERVAKNAALFLWVPSAHLVAGHHKIVVDAEEHRVLRAV